MKRANIGKKISTHEQLQKLVKDKKWIICTFNFGKPASHRHYVAAAFVNRRYVEVCELLKDGILFEYIKNK